MRIKFYYRILFFSLFFIQSLISFSQIVDNGEYYFYNQYYESVLGNNTDNTKPALSAPNTNNDSASYIFVAEESDTKGCYYLRQKNSGYYLAASASNNWSVLLESAKETSNNYLWFIHSGLNGYLSNMKNSSSFLGPDENHEGDTYISVFYDKPECDRTGWEIFLATGDFTSSRKNCYLEVLSRNIESGLQMEQQTNYSEEWRLTLASAVSNADSIYKNVDSLDLIIKATKELNEVLIGCRASDAEILLSEDDFDVEESFTIALNDMKLDTATSSVSILVRNAEGNGAVIDITGSNGVYIQDEVISEDSVMSEVTVNDYQFAFDGSLVSVYRNGKILGSAASYNVSSYTEIGEEAEWTILSASLLKSYNPEIVSKCEALSPGILGKNKYGIKSRYAVSVRDKDIELNESYDFHIIDEDNPLINSSINIVDENAWIVFDNTLPSVVVSKYLSSIKINGQAASIGNNMRVGVYLNGAVIIPRSDDYQPFTGYTEKNFSGDALSLSLGNNELGDNCNSFRSFKLKRGYMAVVASDANCGGYSRVYVADHQDLEISELPRALDLRISCVHLKKWNYVSKKGWCSTTSASAIATECKKVRATWFYTWSADKSSTYDTEYIPIMQHLYWPSVSQISSKTNSTHVLSINEPDHEEQHDDGVISAWTACTHTPKLQKTGMRIGSPAPTDLSWAEDYIDYCDGMAYRCDFVAVHCYWGTNEAANTASWYSQLKSLHDATQRPIWITEWNNGASWTKEDWPNSYGDKLEKNRKAIKSIIQMFDTCSFIERYSVYNWDTYYRAMINTDDGWVTPAGREYRDHKSGFAYNAKVQFTPVWWTPSIKTPKLIYSFDSENNKIDFTVTNNNKDLTNKMVIQRRKIDGAFEDYYEETDRSVFDNADNSYRFGLDDIDEENDEFRVMIVRTVGDTTYSGTSSLSFIVNPNVWANTKTYIEGWTCKKSADNGYTKSTEDTYFEVWHSDADGMYFDYSQKIGGLASGLYELSAACFNSTNSVADATVNGNVGLYAEAEGIQYFAPVTEDSVLDLNNRQTIPYIYINSDSLCVGVKNIGPMSARWAGADEFKLKYLGTCDDVLSMNGTAFLEEMQDSSDNIYSSLFVWNEDSTFADASAIIINPDCKHEDIYGWTCSTIDYKSGESYDAESDNLYWNYWSSSSYTSSMSQEIKFLPPGDYSVSAMMRCSNDATMKLYVSNEEKNNTESTTLTGIGNESSSESEYSNGWQKVSTPTVTIKRGETLCFGFTTSLSNQWWSVDHFTLQYAPTPVSSIEDKNYLFENNIKIILVEGGINVVADTKTTISIYSIDGRFVSKRIVNKGTTYYPLEQGIYVVNNQLVII